MLTSRRILIQGHSSKTNLYINQACTRRKRKEKKETMKFGAICENCMFGLNLFGNTLNSGPRMFKAFGRWAPSDRFSLINNQDLLLWPNATFKDNSGTPFLKSIWIWETKVWPPKDLIFKLGVVGWIKSGLLKVCRKYRISTMFPLQC